MDTIATGEYENLSNEDYWKKRSEEVTDAKFNDLAKVEKEIQKAYKIALDDIQTELNSFYTKYADENGLTYAQATQQLSSYEIGNYQTRMAQLQQQLLSGSNPLAQGEMERLIKQMQHDRLNSLLFQIDSKLLELAGSQQITMEDFLSETYENVYYQTAYQVALGTGIGISFSKINDNFVRQAIMHPWSGQMFSERIWNNRNQLVKQMRETIVSGLISGSSVQRMSRDLSSKMDSSYKNSLRLIRTETAHVIGEAQAKSYESLEVEEYIFIAESRACDVCSSLDSKVFNLKDRQVGKNASPIHANCKCTEAPHFNNRKQAEVRRLRNEDGENEVVANMTVEQWKARYVQ